MTLSEGRLKLLGDQRDEQKAPGGTGVREMETDREAKRRRQ